MAALNLTFYVGIDQVSDINPTSSHLFIDREGMEELLANYCETVEKGLSSADFPPMKKFPPKDISVIKII
jgi:hypothetical protein